MQVGKTTDKNISELFELYSKRIKKYISFELITIPEIKNTRKMSVREQKLQEGIKISNAISSDDFLVLLDEAGCEYRTSEMARWLEKSFLLQKKRIVFVIGGPWGFSQDIYARADFKLSLSKMTFPHQLVRLLFVEQLYRVFTILKGEPYHHE